MTSEMQVAEGWIYSALTADGSVASLVSSRVYAAMAPPGTACPYLVYSYAGGHDVRVGAGTARVFDNLLYLVKAIDQAESYATADAIADRADVVLNGGNGTATGGTVYGCVREQPIRYTEVSGGVQYRHSGGLYRLWVQRT